jgi:hypothetical protein
MTFWLGIVGMILAAWKIAIALLTERKAFTICIRKSWHCLPCKQQLALFTNFLENRWHCSLLSKKQTTLFTDCKTFTGIFV